jgi:hypothetical protein
MRCTLISLAALAVVAIAAPTGKTTDPTTDLLDRFPPEFPSVIKRNDYEEEYHLHEDFVSDALCTSEDVSASQTVVDIWKPMRDNVDKRDTNDGILDLGGLLDTVTGLLNNVKKTVLKTVASSMPPRTR